ncbi:MAG: hypothetical protein IKU68_05925 [Oscillospiraceae bacterium]|nr:hypothetical protein [Oscillospiraceae bacterium]
MQYPYFLSVSGVGLLLESDQPLSGSDAFLPFLAEPAEPDFTAVFRRVAALPPLPEQELYREACYRIGRNETGNFQKFFFEKPSDPVCYAVAEYDSTNCNILVSYLEAYSHCVSEIRNSFFHLGFEELLLRRDKVSFHASCVETPLGGLLFSGVSGIGKSTQANLWCSHRGARQINGDRPILSKEPEGWFAWGSPYAGSSRWYVNDSCPITAILLLKQEKECALRRLSLSEAFRRIWSGLTVRTWDPSSVDRASALALELVQTVPVFEFCCTPDEAAVDYLERELRKELEL